MNRLPAGHVYSVVIVNDPQRKGIFPPWFNQFRVGAQLCLFWVLGMMAWVVIWSNVQDTDGPVPSGDLQVLPIMSSPCGLSKISRFSPHCFSIDKEGQLFSGNTPITLSEFPDYLHDDKDSRGYQRAHTVLYVSKDCAYRHLQVVQEALRARGYWKLSYAHRATHNYNYNSI